jgi:Flp pilus assembly pilin Flp
MALRRWWEAARKTAARRFQPSEAGASLVEYALLLSLIAVISIGALTLVGRERKREFNCVAVELNHPGVREQVAIKISNDAGSLTPLEKRYATACDLVLSP